MPDAEKPDPDDWTRESLSKAREERRKTKAEPEGTIALAKVAPVCHEHTHTDEMKLWYLILSRWFVVVLFSG